MFLEDGLFAVDSFYLYCVQQMHLKVQLQCTNIHYGWMQDIKFAVHAHPTLSEVLDELFKSAKVQSIQF